MRIRNRKAAREAMAEGSMGRRLIVAQSGWEEIERHIARILRGIARDHAGHRIDATAVALSLRRR